MSTYVIIIVVIAIVVVINLLHLGLLLLFIAVLVNTPLYIHVNYYGILFTLIVTLLLIAFRREKYYLTNELFLYIEHQIIELRTQTKQL